MQTQIPAWNAGHNALNCPANAITVNRGVGCAAAVIGSLLGKKAGVPVTAVHPVVKKHGKKEKMLWKEKKKLHKCSILHTTVRSQC